MGDASNFKLYSQRFCVLSVPIHPFLLYVNTTNLHTPGYLAVCLAIEYVQTSPWLLSWLSLDPKTDETADNDNDEDDEDVAAEARRVERMEGLLTEGVGEVVLNNLRKVYRTSQARSNQVLLAF